MKKLILIAVLLAGSNAFSQSWESCIDSSRFYQEKAHLLKALEWAENAYRKQNSEDQLVKNIDLLCSIHDILGNVNSSIEYVKQKAAITKNSRNKELKKEYITSLLDLAEYYLINKEIQKSDSVLKIAEPSAKGRYLIELKDLQAEILMSQGQWEELEQREISDMELQFKRAFHFENYESFIEGMEKHLNSSDKKSKNYIYTYAGYFPGMLYISNLHWDEEFEEFEKYRIDSLYRTAEPVFKQLYGPESQQYFYFLLEMANSFEDADKLEKAEELYLKVYNITEAKYGRENAFSVNALKNLATLYAELGQLVKAQKLFEDLHPLAEKVFGKKSTSYAFFLTAYTNFELQTGRLDNAEKKLNQVLPIIETERGKISKEYAVVVFYKAQLFRLKNHFREATDMINDAVKINEKNGVDCNPCFLNLLIVQADIHVLNEEWDLAEATLIKASDFLDKHAEEFSGKSYQLSMRRTLADFYLACIALNTTKYLQYFPNDTVMENGKKFILSKRTPAYHKHQILTAYNDNIDYYTEKYGKNHPLVADYKVRKALYYWITGGLNFSSTNFSAAKEFWEGVNISQKYLLQYFPYLSEKEKNDLYINAQDNYNSYYAFGLNENPGGLYATDEDLRIHTEKMGADSNFYKIEKIKPVRFTSTIDSIKTYTNIIWDRNNSNILNHRLATKGMIFRSTRNIRKRIFEGNDSTLIKSYLYWEDLKYKLAELHTSEINQAGPLSEKIDSLENLANLLERELSQKSESFKNSQEETNVTWKDIQKRLKYDEAAVEIIRYYLPQYEVDSIRYAALIINRLTTEKPKIVILKNGKDMENRHYQFYKNAIQFKISDNKSYEIFWKEIEKNLNGFSKIYISPDGVYNLINISSFQTFNGKYVLDEKDIRIVNDLKDIHLFTSENKNKNALILGDPDFKKSGNEPSRILPDAERSIYVSNLLREGITPLPGTRKETDQVSTLLLHNGWKTFLHQGASASENKIKSFQGPALLHIATHGFFIDQSNLLKRENPLLRSGILLSEISGSENGSNGEDGILTAYEAMNLDLEQTELVVLSACETGLGEVRSGEGVYGLQRAFRTAGAKNIIMSLWKVNDESTNELMTSFYSEWVQTGNKVTAFRNAQLKIKNKYKDPYYWAAFVLISTE